MPLQGNTQADTAEVCVPPACQMVVPDFKIVCTAPSKAEPFSFSQTAWAQSCMECTEALWPAVISCLKNFGDKVRSAAALCNGYPHEKFLWYK